MLKTFFNSSRINNLYALLHQLLTAGYGFILILMMIRIMPQQDVGRWIIFVSAISISDMLLHGLLQTIIVKEASLSKNDSLIIHRIQNNAMLLSLVLVASISVITFLIKLISTFFEHPILLLNDFVTWYPALGLFMILFNLSWWINAGKGNFKIILVQRIIYCMVSLMVIIIYYLLNHHISFEIAVLSQLAGYAISALYAFFINRFHFHKMHFNWEMIKRFFAYGKFTIGTMLGSSLLRNADTFMIAAYMGTNAVAVYALAQKIIEIFEVMLRSVAATSLPILFNLKNNLKVFSQKLFTRIAVLTIIFVPLAIFISIYSDKVIQLISGSSHYLLSGLILKVFMVYVILLPADRFLGVALEACNLPKLNFIKTLLLITINITGNFIALYYFKSLTGVAAVSSIALSSGIITGFYFLHKKNAAKISSYSLPKTFFNLKFQ